VCEIPGAVTVSAGRRIALDITEPKARRALEHLESLPLVWVDVPGGDEPAGRERGRHLEVLAAGVLRGRAEGDPLLGCRVFDRLARECHDASWIGEPE
jgi:hypothetical protein